MPIEENTKNINFGWRFKNAPDQSELAFSLRLHETKEFGWTITILDEHGESWLSLPASFITEVKNHIEQYLPVSCNGIIPKGNLPRAISVPSPSFGVAMPSIGRKTPTVAHSRKQTLTTNNASIPLVVGARADGRTFDAAQVNINSEPDDDEGVFLPDGHSVSDIDIDQDSTAFETFTVPPREISTPKKVQSPDDASDINAILEERKKAKLKANTENKGIKRRHSISEDD